MLFYYLYFNTLSASQIIWDIKNDHIFQKKTTWTSGQDGGVNRHTVPPRTTKRRTTTIYKQKTTSTDRKSNPMKSDNHGDKEETFIQTGKRGRDRQPEGEDSQQGGGWQT